MTEKAYEKHTWIIFFVLGVLFLMTALFVLGGAGGVDVPAVRLTRNYQIVAAGFALFAMAISATGFRKGERWAWYVMWYVPVASVLIGANYFITGGSLWLVYAVVTPIFLLGLLLPYRKFFPRS